MFLAIDVGNTQTTLGLFDEGGRFAHGWRMSTTAADTSDMLHSRLWGFFMKDGLDLGDATKDFVRSVRTVYDGSFEDQLARVGNVCRLNVFYRRLEDRDAVCALIDDVPTLRHTSSLPCNIEVTDSSAHKGAGLRWLCDYLGVSPADCIAFGDGDNDRTMLEAAGDGVAMANACAATLAAADHVTASCDESGVGRYLAPIFSAMAPAR